MDHAALASLPHRKPGAGKYAEHRLVAESTSASKRSKPRSRAMETKCAITRSFRARTPYEADRYADRQWQPKEGPIAALQHIGPMAQDFYAAFHLGDSDKAIGMQDAEGVALAAIQGLHQLVQEKAAKIEAQQREIENLRKEPGRSEARGRAAGRRRWAGSDARNAVTSPVHRAAFIDSGPRPKAWLG